MLISIRDSGVAAIESLMDRRGAFDYILLETTGLADPGNIAPLFWLDDGLGSSIYLDGVVTLVDAKNILRSLDDPASESEALKEEEQPAGAKSLSSLRRQESKVAPADDATEHKGPHLTTAHLQISHADVIVINKADLVSSAELEAVQKRIRGINGLARIHVTTKSQVPTLEGTLLDLHAYDSVEGIDTFTAKGHSHLDANISSIALSLPTLDETKLEQLDEWLRSVCWESKLPSVADVPFEVHRIKGRINAQDGRMMLLQGVRETFELIDAKDEQSSAGEGKIVVIGRRLDGELWQRSLGTDLSLRHPAEKPL